MTFGALSSLGKSPLSPQSFVLMHISVFFLPASRLYSLYSAPRSQLLHCRRIQRCVSDDGERRKMKQRTARRQPAQKGRRAGRQ